LLSQEQTEDIRGEDGKQNDGWKNLRIKTETEAEL
jgi:hypothetical protein